MGRNYIEIISNFDIRWRQVESWFFEIMWICCNLSSLLPKVYKPSKLHKEVKTLNSTFRLLRRFRAVITLKTLNIVQTCDFLWRPSVISYAWGVRSAKLLKNLTKRSLKFLGRRFWILHIMYCIWRTEFKDLIIPTKHQSYLYLHTVQFSTWLQVGWYPNVQQVRFDNSKCTNLRRMVWISVRRLYSFTNHNLYCPQTIILTQ